MKGQQTYTCHLWNFHKFCEIFIIRSYDFESFVEILNYLSRNLWNFQSWNLQLKSLLQTNVARPISWSICVTRQHQCTVCDKAYDRRRGNFPHSAYYPPFRSNFLHIPFCILPSAFHMPQFHILQTTLQYGHQNPNSNPNIHTNLDVTILTLTVSLKRPILISIQRTV